METQEYTTIRVPVDLWKYLNNCKIGPKETPADVIWKLIKFNDPDFKDETK